MIAATRDSPDDDTLSLVGSSPIIIIEQNFKNPQPIFVNLPCERPRINALKSRLSCLFRCSCMEREPFYHPYGK
jgi:hypothetical protein